MSMNLDLTMRGGGHVHLRQTPTEVTYAILELSTKEKQADAYEEWLRAGLKPYTGRNPYLQDQFLEEKKILDEHMATIRSALSLGYEFGMI